MPDRETLWRFCYAFSWALEALMWETKELWSQEEMGWPRLLRDGRRIPGTARIVQDRFIRVFSDLFRYLAAGDGKEYWQTMESVKAKIFTNWTNWDPAIREQELRNNLRNILKPANPD